MLKSIDLNDKTYADLLSEAISQVPLYSDEWTNFNVSDPGITILQNFSAFQLLQQSYSNEVTEQIRRKLLKLLGFEAAENVPSTVFVSTDVEKPLHLPSQKKFLAGGLCFETSAPAELLSWRVSAVYTDVEGEFREITYLLKRGNTVGAVFGQRPKAGNALYCVLTGEPERGKPLTFWINVCGEERRNPPDQEYPVCFGRTVWQCHTADGWLDLKVEDGTDVFLASGAVRLVIPENARFAPWGDLLPTPGTGIVLRCLLLESDYDLPPKLSALTGNLLELVQQETKSAVFSFSGDAVVDSELLESGNLFVFCRETEGGPYRAYEQFRGAGGRCYQVEELENGALKLLFSKERFGFGPCGGQESVRVVCCDEETVQCRDLGLVYGYEDQIIELDFQGIVPQGFSLLVETKDRDGLASYSFVEPGGTNPDDLCYTLLSEQGKIKIGCPGLGEDCRLFLGSCAVTDGAAGNIRENSQVNASGNLSNVRFTCVSPGKRGVSAETPEQVRLRFAEEMRHPTTGVTAADCEAIVGETPGLCIHKVRVMADESKNIVRIVVKPWTEERFPHLSDLYLRQIHRYLDARRMITTYVELLRPKYIPINVRATIEIKNYRENAREEIEDFFQRELDYVGSEQGFGGTVCYHTLFHALEQLDCVGTVYELKLTPQLCAEVSMSGLDILLGDSCLCYCGSLSLELSSRESMSR